MRDMSIAEAPAIFLVSLVGRGMVIKPLFLL